MCITKKKYETERAALSDIYCTTNVYFFLTIDTTYSKYIFYRFSEYFSSNINHLSQNCFSWVTWKAPTAILFLYSKFNENTYTYKNVMVVSNSSKMLTIICVN